MIITTALRENINASFCDVNQFCRRQKKKLTFYMSAHDLNYDICSIFVSWENLI